MSAPETRPRLLRQAELAELMGVTTRTVRRWARSGLIHEVRIGGAIRYAADAVSLATGGRSADADDEQEDAAGSVS
jgi:excisionase family DNA binding protein